jgi:hypothetical protein
MLLDQMRGGSVMAAHKMALLQAICSCQLSAPVPAVPEPDVTIWHRQTQFNGNYSSIVINTLQIKVTPPLNMSNNYTRT